MCLLSRWNRKPKFAHRVWGRYERNYKCTWYDSDSIATAVQSSRYSPKVWQGASLFWRSKDPAQWQMAKNIINAILNGSVKEVTRHLGRSTVWNGQTAPKLSKPNSVCHHSILPITPIRLTLKVTSHLNLKGMSHYCHNYLKWILHILCLMEWHWLVKGSGYSCPQEGLQVDMQQL